MPKPRGPKKRIFAVLRVSLEVPEGATMQAAMNYVRTAVQAWKGGMDPQNPMFNLDPDKVTVSPLEQRVDYKYGIKP